jgi:hypothetical protein
VDINAKQSIMKKLENIRFAELFIFRTMNQYGEYYVAKALQITFEDGSEKYFSDNEFDLQDELHTDIELVSSEYVDLRHVENIIEAFELAEITPIATVYDRVQRFGGHEEGGWYYDNDHAVREITLEEAKDFKDDLDRYGEGEHVRIGFFFGQHENTETQIYC